MLSLSRIICAHVDVRWLLAGALLAIISKALGSRGWFNIVRASFPRAVGLRWRDAITACFAASGVNGIVPARGGDLVKLAVIRRRIDGACYATLIGTALPEAAFESLCGVSLMVWMAIAGAFPVAHATGQVARDLSSSAGPAALAAILILAVVGVCGVAVARRRRWARSASRVRHGLVILSSPGRFVTRVASWQALARVIRLGSLACFLAAFGLPATLTAAALVMATEGATRLLPFGPVNAGLRMAMLSYGLVAITGRPVDGAALAAFSLGQSATMLAVNLAIGAVLIAREFGTCRPRRAVRRARMYLQTPPSPSRMAVEAVVMRPTADAT